MSYSDEIAAIAAALTALAAASAETQTQPPQHPSRWKRAARHPELEIEEIRAVY